MVSRYAREVEGWLRRHGRLHEAGAEQWAWRYIESYQPTARISDALSIAGAYLLFRSDQAETTADSLPTPRKLLTHLRAIDSRLAELRGVS